MPPLDDNTLLYSDIKVWSMAISCYCDMVFNTYVTGSHSLTRELSVKPGSCEANNATIFVLHDSSDPVPAHLIEIIHPLLTLTVLISTDKQACPRPDFVLTRIAGVHLQSTPAFLWSPLLIFAGRFLFSSWFVFSFDMCGVRKENLCKQTRVNRFNSSLCLEWPQILIA